MGHGAANGWLAPAALALALWFARPAFAFEAGASWTGDFGAVTRGGLQRGQRHWGLLELTLDHTSTIREQSILWHLTMQHAYGGGFSERWVGDLQAVSNIDADSGTRALEAWLELPVARSASLRIGRYDLNSEFDVIPAGGLFLSSSQGIGPDISQTGAAGPSIFPRTAFGVRSDYRFGADAVLRLAVLDVESAPDGSNDNVPFNGGPLLAFEGERRFGLILVKLGAWGFTHNRPAIDPSQPRDKQYGVYGLVEQEPAVAWKLYLRYGLANDDVSRIGQYLGSGIVYEDGLLPGVGDVLGLAVGHARNGTPYRAAQRTQGIATTAAETAIELTWRVPLGDHFVLQPDVQYVVDPDTDPTIDDAVIWMLRVEAAF